MAIDVSEVSIDSDVGLPFTIIRSTGQWVNGVWTTQETEIPAFGTISVAADKELEMIPEGDRVHGAKVFHTDQPILTTRDTPATPGSGLGGASDILVDSGSGDQYRVLIVKRIPGSGYYRAIGTRLSTGA